MKVLITGGSGLIGTALTESLRADGHAVLSLVRRVPSTSTEFQWDPTKGTIDGAPFDGVDAVVNLAGASIGGKRWTEDWKRQILASRLDSTTTLVNAMTGLPVDARPSVLIAGSAVGFYGETGDDAADESTPQGSGFLADVVRQWEAAATPAITDGFRTVFIRTGVVLAKQGGALGMVLPLFKLGVGGRIGSGKQWFSWISLPDEIAAIRWAIDHAEISGILNLTAPEPVTNADYTAAIGRALHRPTIFPVPSPALRLVLGGLADEGVLVSQKAVPKTLQTNGFSFEHPDIDTALAAIL